MQREQPSMRQTLQPLLAGMGRAFGGALVFTLPILMTMEMWDLGFIIEPYRLLLLVLASLPTLMFVSHYSGFETTWGWQDDVRDVAIAFGAALVVSVAVLVLLGSIDTRHAPDITATRIVIQAIPGALGALLGRSQFGEGGDGGRQEESYGGELGVMAVGALYLGFNVAPTEEMVLIAYRVSAWHSLALVLLSLLVMHGFVFASGFKGGTRRDGETSGWSLFLRFTVAGYAVAFAVSLFVLWIFGRIDGLGLETAMRVAVVLAFPAAVGAAAARLII